MLLLVKFHELLQPWRSTFPQQRTWHRAQRLAYGLLLCLRTHLTSNAICATGRQFLDWSADYRLFSRSPWDPHTLFDPIFDHLAELLPFSAGPGSGCLGRYPLPENGPPHPWRHLRA